MPNEHMLQFNEETFWYWGHLIFFIFVVNPIGYLITYYILNRIDPTFKDKIYREKFYSIKNVNKSFILCLLTFYCSPIFFEILSTDIWPTPKMIILGNIYVSTDVAALCFVPELPYSTKIHHTIVLILGIINTFANYHVDGIHRAMTYLAFFSMIPYIVNTRLGTRFLIIQTENKRRLSLIAASIYSLSILANFSVQNYYIFFKGHITPRFINIGTLY